MEVIFLGYADYDFTSKDGNHIDGVKFFYFYPSEKPNYSGYEVGGIFIPRNKNGLIQQIKHAEPGKTYVLQMGFNGRTSFFNGLSSVE